MRPVAVALVLGLLAAGCSSAEPDAPDAGVDDPRPLTVEQSEALATMPFRTYSAGVQEISGQLFGGQNGDMALAGWVDFTADTGYVAVSPTGAMPILVVWDVEQVAYLDVPEVSDLPPLEPPPGAWQVTPLDPGASELTRMLAALLLLSQDRPENPQLLSQNGARFLGTEEIDGESVERFSGVSPTAAGGAVDLGTQYWLDEDGSLARFGIRIAGTVLSTIDLGGTDGSTVTLPVPGDLAGPDVG